MANEVQYILSLKDLLTPEIERADAATSRLEKNILHVGETIAAAFAIHKVVEFGKEILHTTAEFEGFNNIIKYASIDQADGAKNIDYLQDAIKRLHLPMKEAYEQFSELEGGMYGTGIEGQKLRDVFEGIGTASATLHLNADQFSRGAYAIKEIGELGELQARQMRMLAMAIPGSMKIAADALGISTAKLHEEMGQGLIKAGDFLPKFAAKMKEHFAGGLANAGNSLIAKMNDMNSEFVRLQLQMGEDLRPVYMKLMQGVISFTHIMEDAWKWMVKHQEGLKELAMYVGIAVGAWAVYKGIMLTLIIVQKAQVLWSGIQYAAINVLGDGMLTASAASTILAAAQWALNAAMDANPIGVIILALAAVVATIIYAYKHFMEFRAVLFAVWETVKEFGKIVGDVFTGLWHTIHGVFSMSPSEIKLGSSQMVDAMYQSGQRLGDAARKGYVAGMIDFNKDADAGEKKGLVATPKSVIKGAGSTEAPVDISKGSKATGSKNIRIDVKIGNLIGSYTSSVTNIKEMAANIKGHVTAALVSSINDFQIVAGE